MLKNILTRAGYWRRMLLPLLDIINHGDEAAANVQIMQAENGDIYAYTLRDVKVGEEVSGSFAPSELGCCKITGEAHKQCLPGLPSMKSWAAVTMASHGCKHIMIHGSLPKCESGAVARR